MEAGRIRKPRETEEREKVEREQGPLDKHKRADGRGAQESGLIPK